MPIKIPKNERGWVVYLDSEHNPRYIVTSKESRECYFLYKILDGKLERLGKAPTPDVLEKKFGIENELGPKSERPKRGRKKGVE